MPDKVHASRLWGRIGLAWLAVAILFVVVAWDRLLEWRFPDPDDTLRVVQVRDLLAGQGWFDLHQYRINPGDSPIMHWSRLVDAPLLLLIAVLSPVLDPESAEAVAVFAIPLLTLGAIMAVVGRMAGRLFGPEIAGFACLACGLSPILLGQLQPLRVDHHGWQAFAVAVAASGLSHKEAHRGGAIAGLAMAVGLLVSIELLPLAATAGAILLLRWLRDPAQRWGLPVYLGSLGLGLVGLFGLTRGFADLAPHCDAISPAHLLFFVSLAGACLGIASRRSLAPPAIVGGLACAGGVGVALFLWQAPACLAGPFGTLDPLVREHWYLNVLEGQPFWLQPFHTWLPVVAQSVVALATTLVLWRASEAEQRSWWRDYALLLAAALVGGLLVWRSMAFVGVLAALPNGWLIHRLLARVRTGRTPVIRLGTVVAAIFALMPAAPTALAQLPRAQQSDGHAGALGRSTCDLRRSMSKLAPLEPATFFAPLDIGPAFLERTRHSVVATGHHRAQVAMRDIIFAFQSSDAVAEVTVKGHGARYLAVCTDLLEPQLYARNAPDGLMAHLLRGKTPRWLEEFPIDGPPNFKVWRVVE